MSTVHIPVVDLGQLGLHHESDPTEVEWQRVGKEIIDAFKDIGFVYLKRHGIPEEKFNRLVNAGAQFFDLPAEVKNRYPRDPELQHGFIAIDREKFYDGFTHELREAYDIRLRSNGIYPDEVMPDFRPAATKFMESCMKLVNRLLIAMALGLELDRHFFVDTHKDMGCLNNATCMRLLYYPPVPADIQPNTTRCGIHSDYGTITLLFQDDMGGLSVLNRNGEWINADPIEGTILVNVGDFLQMWTNDKLIATKHRVLIPAEEVRQRRCRRSLAFFIHPDDSVPIRPIDGSSKEKVVTAKEYVDKKFSETYQY